MRIRMGHACAFGLFLAVSAKAQEAATIWQGTFKMGGELHRGALEIDAAHAGGWEAKSLSIEFVPDAVKIDSLAMNGSTLKFSMNSGKGAYDGKISADGASIEGTWTYDGHPAALELRRATKETAWHLPTQYQYHFKEVTIPRPSPEEQKIPFSPKLALDYLDQGAVAWSGERQCVACHTNGSYMVVRPLMTEQLG